MNNKKEKKTAYSLKQLRIGRLTQHVKKKRKNMNKTKNKNILFMPFVFLKPLESRDSYQLQEIFKYKLYKILTSEYFYFYFCGRNKLTVGPDVQFRKRLVEQFPKLDFEKRFNLGVSPLYMHKKKLFPLTIFCKYTFIFKLTYLCNTSLCWRKSSFTYINF